MFERLFDSVFLEFRNLGNTLLDSLHILALFFLSDLWALIAPIIGQA